MVIDNAEKATEGKPQEDDKSAKDAPPSQPGAAGEPAPESPPAPKKGPAEPPKWLSWFKEYPWLKWVVLVTLIVILRFLVVYALIPGVRWISAEVGQEMQRDKEEKAAQHALDLQKSKPLPFDD